jgi:hypothetical protein
MVAICCSFSLCAKINDFRDPAPSSVRHQRSQYLAIAILFLLFAGIACLWLARELVGASLR